MLYEWIRNIDFLWPENFILLGLLPLLVWFYSRKSSGREATMTVSSVSPFKVKSLKTRLRHLPFIFRCLALASLVFALARPQKRNDQQQTKGEGIDIVLCMDVSGSMGTRDILPSRMEVAKQVAEDFVMARPVDRIGLVIFSGESFTQCPLTTDKNTLIHQIQTLESRRFLKDGTVIGEGLATAVDRLAKSNAKSKVIILLTDGKEDAPDTRLIDPLTALEIARSRGVKIYSIGMGAAQSTIVELTNKQPTDKNPSAYFLDEQLLNKMAVETGGQYFRARDKESLQGIYARIDKLEKSDIQVVSYKRYIELFYPFLFAALSFLFLEVLLRFTLLRKFP
ncbi:MAG: VWA domain-containing protein [Chitinophagaceae bacterium]|nr:MAG: VWA domain-containing protein [Chitinophagaceae bacterium]